MRARRSALVLTAILAGALSAACQIGSHHAATGLRGLGRGLGLAPRASAPAIPSELAGMTRPLVFVGGSQIYRILPNGTHQRILTRTPENSWPALSPDGTRIAFARTVGRNTDIFVMDSDGAHLRRLTTARAPDYHPTWSPDGKGIAFESMRDGNAEIYVMHADGTDQRNVTHDPALDGSPAWSPDGRWIAFESIRSGDYELYKMHPDGSHLVRLTRARGEDTDPAWSPDGRTIAFSSARYGQPRLFVMNPDGTTQIMVSPPASKLGVGVAHGMFTDAHPTWSPNSDWLAFETTRMGTLQVWAMRADGESAVPLTVAGWNGTPSWG